MEARRKQEKALAKAWREVYVDPMADEIPAGDREKIERFIAERGVTKCEPAHDVVGETPMKVTSFGFPAPTKKKK